MISVSLSDSKATRPGPATNVGFASKNTKVWDLPQRRLPSYENKKQSTISAQPPLQHWLFSTPLTVILGATNRNGNSLLKWIVVYVSEIPY